MDFAYYFIVVILISIVLLIFIAHYVKLKVLLTGLTVSRIPQVEAMAQTKSECDICRYICLAIGLFIENSCVVNVWKIEKFFKPWHRKLFANTVHIYGF